MNMYVSNLDFQVKEEDLRQLFAPFGEVTSVKVIKDRETGRSRGFAFVEMSSAEAANKAITSLNNKELSGRAISVSQAKEREDRPRRSLW